MPSFAKRLHLRQYELFEFVFTHIYTFNSERFVVKVMEGKRELCHFTMQPVLHYWMITDAQDLPEWIADIEQELEKIIKQNYHAVA